MNNVKKKDVISIQELKLQNCSHTTVRKYHALKHGLILLAVIVILSVTLFLINQIFHIGVRTFTDQEWEESVEYQAGQTEPTAIESSEVDAVDEKSVAHNAQPASAIVVSEQGYVLGADENPETPSEVKLDVNWLSQNPELPTGCEITSLTTVLNYDGCKVNKIDMAEKYLEKSYTGSFKDKFIGDPETEYGYGCYAKPIIKAANKYFTSNHMKASAIDLTGSDFKDLFSYIRQGYPIIIWNTINMVPAYETDSWEANGKTVTWIAPEHCVVMTGYDLDRNVVYVSDPLVGNVERDMNIFEDRYDSLLKQAVYITLN